MLNYLQKGRKIMAADLAALKINTAYSHLEKIAEFEKRGINGATKLKKRIQAEINFLKKVSVFILPVIVSFSPFLCQQEKISYLTHSYFFIMSSFTFK